MQILVNIMVSIKLHAFNNLWAYRLFVPRSIAQMSILKSLNQFGIQAGNSKKTNSLQMVMQTRSKIITIISTLLPLYQVV